MVRGADSARGTAVYAPRAIRARDLASSSGNVGVSTRGDHLERMIASRCKSAATVGRRGVTKGRELITRYPCSTWHSSRQRSQHDDHQFVVVVRVPRRTTGPVKQKRHARVPRRRDVLVDETTKDGVWTYAAVGGGGGRGGRNKKRKERRSVVSRTYDSEIFGFPVKSSRTIRSRFQPFRLQLRFCSCSLAPAEVPGQPRPIIPC